MVANMWTRHPDKFGAIVCNLPLTDMRRYTKLLNGSSWVDEYTDPDDPEEWEHLQHISAYHADLTSGDAHTRPPILIATNRTDDRVHPGHARKMAERLRENGANVLYHEAEAGGHGFGITADQQASFKSLGMSFLRKSIGWEV
jgi:prolyl oligopeptidase